MNAVFIVDILYMESGSSFHAFRMKTILYFFLRVPLVVLPSVFYWNAHNRIIVTPPGQSPDIVDVHLKIWSDEEIVFQQILSAKLAGENMKIIKFLTIAIICYNIR